MAIAPIEPIAFTVADAVAYSGLARSRIYELIGANELASFRVGGRRLILRTALDGFIAKLAEAA